MSSIVAGVAPARAVPKRRKRPNHVTGCACIDCVARRDAGGQRVHASYGYGVPYRPHAVADDIHQIERAMRQSEDARVWAWWQARSSFRWYCASHAYDIMDQMDRWLAWVGLTGELTAQAAWVLVLWDVVIAAESDEYSEAFARVDDAPDRELSTPMRDALEYMESANLRLDERAGLESEDMDDLREISAAGQT